MVFSHLECANGCKEYGNGIPIKEGMSKVATEPFRTRVPTVCQDDKYGHS